MAKLLLLLTVTLAAAYYTDDNEFIERHIILRNGGRCLMAKPMRELLDNFHNNLRREVALGHNYLGHQFQPQEMCGLIYDCEMERVALKELDGQGNAAKSGYGVVRIKHEVKKSQFSSVKEGLEKAAKENDILRQMINPKATKFGCGAKMSRSPTNTREVNIVCLYDRKTRRKNPQQPKGESCCVEHDCDRITQCTFYKNAKCLWDLCYVPAEGEDIDTLM
ncbi:hypothetical protein Y032_0387g459 [Ancylostoma ceylanicum]|uniref:SCP domain-containing protein n=1 Tax=Ancylostoma ceylanicum TaxID=53326 RepID=A0A016RTI0_9BILA|nr:hypothetical protein Y032_0387g459 [Ancylostoma ceylanicum]